MNFTDIHTHILYGIDDGADSVDTALLMLDRAYRGGTRSVFLTPHCTSDRMDTESMQKKLSLIRDASDRLFEGLTVYPGCELMYSQSGIESVLRGDIPTLAGSHYLLVEFHPYADRRTVREAVARTVQSGLIPVIAHIERYRELDKNDIARLADGGAYIQVNASSVTGGLLRRRYVMSLIKSELVHFIASDAHNLTSRPPELGISYRAVLNRFGEDCAERLFYKNPLSIIEDRII